MNPPSVLLCPIVGAFHRPPAKQVLSVLRTDTNLLLVPDPDNPYDPKAVKVLVDLTGLRIVDFEALRDALEGTGHDPHDLLSSPEPLQLGFLADSEGKALSKLTVLEGPGLSGNRAVHLALHEAPPWAATLCWGAAGTPLARIKVPAPLTSPA